MSTLLIIYAVIACIAAPLLTMCISHERRMKRLYEDDRDWWKSQAKEARTEASKYFNKWYDAEMREAALRNLNKNEVES